MRKKKKKDKEVFPRTAESASFITYMARMEEKDRHVNPFLSALSGKERQVNIL